MRILFFDFDLPQLLRDAEHPVGGWCIQLNLLLRALSQNGHHVGVLTWKGANGYVGPQTVCDLVETYDPSAGTPRVRFFTHRVPLVVASARSYAPDVIIQSCAGLVTGMMASTALRLGVPFVYRVAADGDAEGGSEMYMSGLDRIGFRYGLSNADLVICQNDYQQMRLHDRYPKKSLLRLDNVIEIPPNSNVLNRRSERRYVVWLGNFRFVKNLGLLYRVARQLPDIEFLVAGKAGKEVDLETKEALEGLNFLPNVRLLGYVKRSDVFPLIAGAVATLCTSHVEGFPNTFLESFAMGTPVVTRAGVDPNFMVERFNLGFVCDDEAKMVANIRRVWAMEESDFDELSNRCRDYVATNHSPAIVAERLIPALEKVILGRG